MSKSLLIGAVKRAAPEIPADVAKGIVDSVLETISSELVTQGSFTLHEVGSLSLQHKPARRGRNPATGAQITIEPRTAVRYRVSSVLAGRISQQLAKTRKKAV